MQYLTLEKESGAIQAVNMGLIGEKVEIRVKDWADGEWANWYKDTMCFYRAKQVSDGIAQIRIPKPTIEDIRIGDTVSYLDVDVVTKKVVVTISSQRSLDKIKEKLSTFWIKDLKLITRKSEGVDVLEVG